MFPLSGNLLPQSPSQILSRGSSNPLSLNFFRHINSSFLESLIKPKENIFYEVNKNPNLWSQRHKLEEFDVDNIEEYEELEDDEREALEDILSDPRKFKLFTTAKSLSEIQQEAAEVKKLFEMAQSLYNRNQEEKKFQQLQELLTSNGVLENNEKLVIFTEIY